MLIKRVDAFKIHLNKLVSSELSIIHCCLQLNDGCFFQLSELTSGFLAHWGSFPFIGAVQLQMSNA